MNYNFYLLRTKKAVNDIRYIGVTTRTFNERYSLHKCAAKSRRGLPLYNWWRKRLFEGYTVIIEPLEVNFTGNWEERELYWIRHYKQMGFDLLNVSRGGSGIVTDAMRSEESRQRTINAHKKPIIALTLDGKFYKEYSSCKEAAKDFNTSWTSISNACKNRWSKSSCGHLWVFKSEYDPLKEYKYPEPVWDSCYKFDLNGNLVQKYSSIPLCCKHEYIDERKLRKYINNKYILNNCIYSTTNQINVNDYTYNIKYTVFKYDINNNLVSKYSTLKEFFRKENFSTYKYYNLSNRKLFTLDTGEIIKVL